MDIPIKHLSASSITDYLDCPLKWFGRRIAKWPEVKPPFFQAAAAMGRAVHSALSAHHRGQDADTALVRCWETETQGCAQGLVSLAETLPLVRAYTSVITPKNGDKPDHRFSYRVPGVRVPIIGYIDVLSGATIREFKTTRSHKNWTQADIDTSIQGSIYWAAILSSGEAKRPKLTYSILRIGGDPIMTEVQTERTDSEVRRTEMLIRGVYERMRDGDLEPRCKAGYCGFPSECHRYGYTEPQRSSEPAQALRASRRDSSNAGSGNPFSLDTRLAAVGA